MKILVPVMTLSRSGGFKVLTQLANFGENFGHQVNFLCPYSTEKPYYDANFEIIWINKAGEPLKGSDMPASQVKGIQKLIALWLYLLKYSSHYDAVIANRNLTAYPVYFGSRSNNFYYIQAYEPEFCGEYRNVFKRYTLMFIAWFSYFLPLSKIVNATIYKKYKNIRSNYVVPPGIDLTVFNPLNRRIFSPENDVVVGCIGRIETWKGTNDVTEAVKLLNKKRKNVKYKVAFNPVDHQDYDLVLPEGHEGLANFYRSLDILVAPGHIQLGAAHYPVMEAMACGTLVVTTGYYPADEGNAYIVPVKSPARINEAIIKIISSPINASFKRDKALEDIEKLAWPNVAAKFYSIIENKVTGA